MEQQQQCSSISENSVTFKVDNVKLCKEPPKLQTVQEALMIQEIKTSNSEDFSHKGRSEKNIVGCYIPGFMAAIHTAYACHYALKVSVSDFILLIGQGLSKHIEQNAEKLRHHFVNHEGKEKIVIRRDQFVRGELNDWSTVFGEFAEEIKKRVKADVYGVVIDDTSVATPITRIVSEITLMDAMKSYLDYSVMTLCGIPQITLEGTPDDWKKLQDKVAKLIGMNKDNCLELKWWLDKLVPVVEKICEAGIEGKIDGKFWSEIYKCEGGSGGPYLSGWITTFFPYLAEEKVNTFQSEFITSANLPKQYCLVPFIWDYLGEEISMFFYGGFSGAEFDKETSTVKPAHFWCVKERSKSVYPDDDDDDE